EAPVLVIHQSDAVLEAMDAWNKSTHGKSGLVDKVKAATLTEGEAESRLIEVLKPLVAAGTAPLAGNTVHQDRRFMARYMPAPDRRCARAPRARRFPLRPSRIPPRDRRDRPRRGPWSRSPSAAPRARRGDRPASA